MTKWNGIKCKARRVLIRVGASPKSTWWCAPLEGDEHRAVEISVGSSVFYISDEDGNGWHKVIAEGGGPHWGHKSIPCAEVIRERTEMELDDRDCRCGAV